MIKKVNFLLYLSQISSLFILRRIIDKLFPDKKYSTYIGRWLFVKLRSTHDRRLISANNLIKANLKSFFSDSVVTSLQDDNMSFVDWPLKKLKKIIYLIGDSHVEFYGRNSVKKEFRDYNSCVLWLGPRSFIGAYYSSMYKEWLQYTLLNIKALEKGSRIDKRNFVISLGSIDIRCPLCVNIDVASTKETTWAIQDQ